ncbi:Murein DD-endopeptidase MepM [Methylobacterium trifolii]|uniref:Murein DD-endopeptidase MepM n=2 Tax=Methylobacterium trifolii TaxID=1003092 RepID=A0ABQ4U1R0_9HYPH|nr:Murein DD-endopeptidase MepM [Methylobacterium trifolii]
MVEDGARLRRVATALPLRRPTGGEAVVSSTFGTALDPFTRGLALHTGLDLKAESGEPARATAPGRVTAAEPAGGYGNMVEIDHGHGVVTRFAHLGRIAVQPGQVVRAGDLVGQVGSTGRSTGAHLHYETRVDGEPVDPQRFLDAGRRFEALASAQSMSSTTSAPP